jgi:hypothetical protein
MLDIVAFAAALAASTAITTMVLDWADVDVDRQYRAAQTFLLTFAPGNEMWTVGIGRHPYQVNEGSYRKRFVFLRYDNGVLRKRFPFTSYTPSHYVDPRWKPLCFEHKSMYNENE